MKKIIFTALLMASFCACTKETINYQNPTPGENGTGANTTLAVASRNTLFSSEDDVNGSIAFKSLGGKVVLDVNTNAKWEYEISGDSFVKAEKDVEADRLVLTCGQNKNEKKLSATVTIKAGNKTATVTATQNPFGTVEIVASENNFHLAAKGELTASFEVTSTDPDWTFETSACEWMLVKKDGNTVNVSVYPNDTYSDREVEFILKAGGSDNPVTETINVLQDRSALIESSVSTVPVTPFSNDAKEVEVKANFDWEYSISGNESGWLTVVRTENGFKLVPTVNSGAETRTVKITVTTGDGKENVDTKEIIVSQPGIDKDALILGVHVKEGAIAAAKLPVKGVSEVTVDWGDGKDAETFTTDFPTHEYADTGYFVVSVKGQATGLSTSSLSYEQKYQLENVYNWGRLGLTSMDNAFDGCIYLANVPTDDTGAFSKVTSFKYAFQRCEKFTEIPEGLMANAGELLSVESMFQYCYYIKSIPAKIFANCPKLQSVKSAFYMCREVKSVDKDLFANNPEITNAEMVFSNMYRLSSIDEDIFANNAKITTLNAVFSQDSSLTSIPAGIFRNLPECTSFRMAFIDTGISEVPADLFANNHKCTNFQQTFCRSKIKTISSNIFKGCSKVTTFLSCFNGCEELEVIPADLFTSSGAQATVTKTGMNMVFKGCASITEVPEGLFDGFTTITQFSSVFDGCNSLRTIPSGLFKDLSSVTTFSQVFKDCVSLEGVPEGVFTGLSKVTSLAGVFEGCTGITVVGDNILDGCSACTNISSLFKNCTNLAKVSENAFAGATKVTSIASLFYGCTSLKNVPEGIFAPLTGVKTTNEIFASSGI